MEIKKDNSLKHTALKLFEFGLGYGLGLLFYYQDLNCDLIIFLIRVLE
jgi:hypothetical protein